MSEVEAVELKKAVESMHACKATLAQSVPVAERDGDATVWEGVVHVFNLTGHPKATRAYTWSAPIEGSDKRRILCRTAPRAGYVACRGRAGSYRGGSARGKET